MTRLELLHTIQDNADRLTMHDAFALLASRLPEDPNIAEEWYRFSLLLSGEHLY